MLSNWQVRGNHNHDYGHPIYKAPHNMIRITKAVQWINRLPYMKCKECIPSNCERH